MNILERKWRPESGASEAAIQQLCEASTWKLPEKYIALLRTTNGGEGPLARQPWWLCLDSAETVAEAVTGKSYDEFFPGFLMIGTSGGGDWIAFDLRTPGSMPVVAIDMTNIDLEESVMLIAPAFDEFVELVGRSRD